MDKIYFTWIVRFDNASPLLINAHTPERAIEKALEHEADSLANAFAGKKVTLNNILDVAIYRFQPNFT